MSEQTPTLMGIYTAFFNAMQEAVVDDVAAKRLVVVPPAQDFKPDAKSVHLISALRPGTIQPGELGPWGLSKRPGVWMMTLSALKTEAPGIMWRLAEKLEQAFFSKEDGQPLVLPTVLGIEDKCPVYCEEPYTSNIGETSDKRIELSVTVPWWAWAGGNKGD